MSPSSSTSASGNANMSPAENCFMHSLSLLNSEKAVQDIMEQPMLPGTDDHLVEFSEALRTVAKALRRVTGGKAAAQAEASEWKRKYELERDRYLHLEQKVVSSEGHCSKFNVGKARELDYQTMLPDENREQCDLCSGKDICDHQVLRDCGPDLDSSEAQNKLMSKAPFKLSWCGKGEKNDRHKHDIVSFDKGNITTAERSSKQISLKWESPPQTVLLLTWNFMWAYTANFHR